MLIREVFVEAGLVENFDIAPYSQDFHLHRGEERYLAFVEAHLKPVETPDVGDVMLFRIGRVYSHGGVVTGLDPIKIIHAYMNAGEVCEDRLRPDHELMLPKRAPRFYTLWPKG